MNLPKISLAQWSLHRAFQQGQLNPIDFPEIALKEYNIPAVEYVNQFYKKQRSNQKYWKELRRKSEDLGVKNLLIMVDDEGLLGHSNPRKRRTALENHIRWVEAANLLDCHAIRVNAFGNGTTSQLKDQLVDSLSRLAQVSSEFGISVLIENHGHHTSDADFMTSIIKAVNHPGLGTLPDFGNWCLTADWGSTQGGLCTDNYGPVRGVNAFLPWAKGVSAKSYDFDLLGNETLLPYNELLKSVKEAGYAGYIGIEYEGNRLSEPDGIRATKALVERIWTELP
ncbi:MAG: hypothetical protein RLZZ241_1194 [Bacteroidota bacterium]